MFARQIKAVIRPEHVLEIVLRDEIRPVVDNHNDDAAALAKDVRDFNSPLNKSVDIMIHCMGENPI